MERHDVERVSVLALLVDPQPATPARLDDGPTQALLARHGLVLERRSVYEYGETLAITRVRSVAAERGAASVNRSSP
jgi:hypothetical protein